MSHPPTQAPGHAAEPLPNGPLGFRFAFPALLVATFVIGVGVYALTWNPQPSTDGLRRFLEQGPTTGLWETRRMYSVRRAYFAPLPGDASRILMAPVPGEKSPTGCRTCDAPCSYTRPQVMQFFFEASGALFFRNYRMIKGPEPARLPDGRATWWAIWAPRFRDGGLSEREVWFDRKTGELVQIEDFSRTGRLTRRARKVQDDTGDWNPASFDASKGPVCCAGCPSDWLTEEEQLELVADEAEFPVLRPTALPPGFQFVRATYREMPLPAVGSTDEETQPTARAVTLLYSDGMALVSIGVAPTADMDAIEQVFAQMRRERPAEAGDEGCPTLPVEPRRVPVHGKTLRIRRDACRTVLRRDLGDGMSVTLLGRNELTIDEYVDVISNLERFIPPPEDD